MATLPTEYKFPMNNMPNFAVSTNCQEWMEKLVYNTALEGESQLEVRCFPSYEHFAFFMSLIY